MKRFILLILWILVLAMPVSAMEFTAPTAPNSAQEYMPADVDTFGDGLWHIIKIGINNLQPHITDALGICVSLICIVLLASLLKGFQGAPKQMTELVSTLLISIVLLKPSNVLIGMGVNTVKELSEYGKLLLPVMTAATAAQGGVSVSAALYLGTAFFNSFLTTMISKLIVPMIYIYLCLCVVNSAIGEETLKKLRDFLKWLMTWSLKIIIYIFTGFISISGVVSGTADATAIKATKLAISGFIPVVGGVISDASETIVISAGVMKNAAGVYGLLAILSVWIGPFLQIGVQCILLKVTAAICSVFGTKQPVDLIQAISTGMGFVLAMTGTICLLLLISTGCFMKGVG